MARFARELFVPYSPQRMFGLVDRIEDYPEYLPWCDGAQVTRLAGNEVRAELRLRKGPVSHSFTTANVHDPEAGTIDVRLARGPFSSLEGRWTFLPKDGGCLIGFEIEYAFSSRILDKMLGPLFQNVYERMVGAFARRADEVYGKNADGGAMVVEVVHVGTDRQHHETLRLAEGAVVGDALRQSGLAEAFANLDLEASPVGINSRVCDRDTQLRDGDRVEVYRPLAGDPYLRRRKGGQ